MPCKGRRWGRGRIFITNRKGNPEPHSPRGGICDRTRGDGRCGGDAPGDSGFDSCEDICFKTHAFEELIAEISSLAATSNTLAIVIPNSKEHDKWEKLSEEGGVCSYYMNIKETISV